MADRNQSEKQPATEGLYEDDKSHALDLMGLWPELFEGLDAKQVEFVEQTLAINWHSGWIPNYEDVKDFTDLVRGTIDEEEYNRRGREASPHKAQLYRDNPVSDNDKYYPA